MAMKSIRALKEEYGVSRQKLQRLDQAGVLSPTVKAAGGWLYDEAAVRRLILVSVYQEYGYSMKEIREVLSRPERDTLELAREKVQLLKERRDKLDRLIDAFNKGEELMMKALQQIPE